MYLSRGSPQSVHPESISWQGLFRAIIREGKSAFSGIEKRGTRLDAKEINTWISLAFFTENLMNYRSRTYFLISITLQISLAFLLFNLIFNGHFHLAANGTRIYHAHPFPASAETEPIKNHQHSRFEFLLLHLVTHLFERGFRIVFVFLPILFTTILKKFHCSPVRQMQLIFRPATRAPPLVAVL